MEPGRLWLSWDEEMDRWAVWRRCRRGDHQILFFVEDRDGNFERPDWRILDRLHLGDSHYYTLEDARASREAMRREHESAKAEVGEQVKEFLREMDVRKSSIGPGGPVDGHKWDSGDMVPPPKDVPVAPTTHPGARYQTVRAGG